jgi:NAD(P)-dependent dehydrogenase (short-subunit alcohol dehydrogenase family)
VKWKAVDIHEQRVLVRAGAAGIGREIVRAFAANGAKVSACDVDVKALDALAQEIKVINKCLRRIQAGGHRTHDDCGCVAVAALDVLVNNAGIPGATAPGEQMDSDQWEKVMQLDLTGRFNVNARAAVPHLKKSQAGVIINMSSAAGRFGYANRSPYCTAKWGIIGFTKTLSIEVGEYEIRANAILPGAVDRPRIQKVFEGRATSSGKSVEEIKTEAMAVQSLKTFVDLGISRPLPYSSPRMQPSRFQARCWRLTMTCSRHPDGDKEKQSTQVKNYEQPINILLRDDLAAKHSVPAPYGIRV